MLKTLGTLLDMLTAQMPNAASAYAVDQRSLGSSIRKAAPPPGHPPMAFKSSGTDGDRDKDPGMLERLSLSGSL